MKIAIIGANGKSGSNLVQEALKQGYDVTGFARNKEYKNGAIKLVHKDVFELSKADLAGFDVVISAIAAWTPQTFTLHAKMTQYIAELQFYLPNFQFAAKKVRIVKQVFFDLEPR